MVQAKPTQIIDAYLFTTKQYTNYIPPGKTNQEPTALEYNTTFAKET